MIKIGQASHDENGKYVGGKAGDQTGSEVAVREWYSRPWNVVLRPKQEAVANFIVNAMKDACNNNHIGYDQNQRTTLYYLAKESGWDISSINTDCETDCSALVSVCVNCAGIYVDPDIYTGTEKKILLKTGQFTELTDSKYLKSDTYLRAGDILLYEGHHTAVALEDGPQTDPFDDIKTFKIGTGNTGLTVTASVLSVRKAPKTGSVVGEYGKGEQVFPIEKANVNGVWWYHVSNGWVCASYLTGWVQESDGRWWYLYPGYTWASSGWKQIDSVWYMFGEDGYIMQSMWIQSHNRYYYVDADGVMAVSAFVKSTNPEKPNTYYWLNKDGLWDGKEYGTNDTGGYNIVI